MTNAEMTRALKEAAANLLVIWRPTLTEEGRAAYDTAQDRIAAVLAALHTSPVGAELPNRQTESNYRKLVECARPHDFQGGSHVRPIIDPRCTKCDGAVTNEAASWYRLGLGDAGWPRRMRA